LSAASTYWQISQIEYFGEPETNLSSPSDKSSNQQRNAAAAAIELRQSMDAFLAEVERKAFVIARMSLRNNEDALDTVQDAMISLVNKYSDRPTGEWKPLFYRILRNRIVDYQRRQNVRQRIMAWLPTHEDAPDPIAEAPGIVSDQPDRRIESDESMDSLQLAVADLPARQQQAFLLRTIEGLNVAQTATAMGCSAGSVKTHYSRAVHRLRLILGEHWENPGHD